MEVEGGGGRVVENSIKCTGNSQAWHTLCAHAFSLCLLNSLDVCCPKLLTFPCVPCYVYILVILMHCKCKIVLYSIVLPLLLTLYCPFDKFCMCLVGWNNSASIC